MPSNPEYWWKPPGLSVLSPKSRGLVWLASPEKTVVFRVIEPSPGAPMFWKATLKRSCRFWRSPHR